MHRVGVVDHLSYGTSRVGNFPTAYASLPDRFFMVRLPPEHTCLAGGPIRIVQQPYLLGPALNAEMTPCPPIERVEPAPWQPH